MTESKIDGKTATEWEELGHNFANNQEFKKAIKCFINLLKIKMAYHRHL